MIPLILIVPLIIIVFDIFFTKINKEYPIYILNYILSVLVGFSFFSLMKCTKSHDVEYNGHHIVEAKYIEPYETYNEKICEETIIDGNGGTTQLPYDCSTCDRHKEKYYLIDSNNREISVDKEEYEKIVRFWDVKPDFVDLSRRIKYTKKCGFDGDSYVARWNGGDSSLVPSTTKVSYKNVVKYGNNAFSDQKITKEEATALGLFDYPTVIKGYEQPTVLGLDNVTVKNKENLLRTINIYNAKFGKINKNRVFVMIFDYRKRHLIEKQKNYWEGGNRNEVNIMIGVDKDDNIKWVDGFTWSENKVIIPVLRRKIVDVKNLECHEMIYDAIKTETPKYFKWRDTEEDLKHISFQPTGPQLFIVFLVISFFSIGFIFLLKIPK